MTIISFEKLGDQIVVKLLDNRNPEVTPSTPLSEMLDAPVKADAVRLGDDFIFERLSGQVYRKTATGDVPVVSVDDWPEEGLDLWFCFEMQNREPTYRDVAVALGFLEFRPQEFLDARK